MANHYVPETPTFNAGVRKFETTDRNHADTLNVPIAQLVENDNYLKKELEKKANQDEQNKIYTVSELSGQSLKNAKMYFVKVQRGQTVTQIGQYSIFKENNAQITSLKGNTNTDKVYSLYFDSSKNGFFLRASATGTAAADHVLAGKTFSSETDTDQTGTMINRGNWGATLDSAGQIVVPNGYHDGTGIVKANTISGRTIMPGQNEQLVIEAGKLATGDIRVSGDSNLSPDNIRHGSNIFGTNGRFTSDATAETYHLQEGKTAYVRGQKIIGTQQWRGNQIQSVTPSRQNQRVSIQGGIHQGGGYIDVVGDSDLIPANIRQGTNIFGVSGTYDGGRSQIANALTNKGVPTSTSATAEQIVENVKSLPSTSVFVDLFEKAEADFRAFKDNSEGSLGFYKDTDGGYVRIGMGAYTNTYTTSVYKKTINIDASRKHLMIINPLIDNGKCCIGQVYLTQDRRILTNNNDNFPSIQIYALNATYNYGRFRNYVWLVPSSIPNGDYFVVFRNRFFGNRTSDIALRGIMLF